jgi:hypothetical protein
MSVRKIRPPVSTTQSTTAVLGGDVPHAHAVNDPHTPTNWVSKTETQAFIHQIHLDSLFFPLFNHIHDVCFFVKDIEGHILIGDRELLRHFGFNTEDQISGKTDFELHPYNMAVKYREDDLAVIRSGKPMLRIVELFINHMGLPDWYVTDKLPVFSKTDTVIGVMGIIQKYDSARRLGGLDHSLSRILRYIEEHFDESPRITQLASMIDLPVRQFERWFKDYLKLSSQQYIMKTRIFHACEELRVSQC